MNKEPEPLKGTIVAGAETLDGKGALQATTSAEIDMAVATAHRWPRPTDNQMLQDRVAEWALIDPETAESMFYVLKRKGKGGKIKRIEGPSSRLAEIVADAWGNIRWGARVVAIDHKFIHAQGVAQNLENMNFRTSEVARSIVSAEGVRFSENLIMVTGNAACSIAARNALFQIIPRAKFKQVYEAIKKKSIDSPLSLEEQIANAFKAFNDLGATDEQILEALGKPDVSELVADDVIDMRGMFTAITKEGASLQDALGIQVGGKKVETSKLDLDGKAEPLDLDEPSPEQIEQSEKDRASK